MHQISIILSIIAISIAAASVSTCGLVPSSPLYVDAQTSNTTTAPQQFYSAKDLFVTSDPAGYGMYEERDSNTFLPGEEIILYIEPKGFAYATIKDSKGNPLYSIDFGASFAISDKKGNVLSPQQELPIDDIISHYQNKEVIIPFTISGTEAIPPGEYAITYSITDNNSGNTFDIVKDVTIAANSIANNTTSAVNSTT
jgi:hypothetical protein